MPKKKPKKGKPKVHKDLEGFEININEFGEMTSNMGVEDLNKFLNKNVDDKKLRDRDDLKEQWEEEAKNEEEVEGEDEDAIEDNEDVAPQDLDDIDDEDIDKLKSKDE